MRTTTIDKEIQEEREQFKRARKTRKNKSKNHELKNKSNLNIILTILFSLGTIRNSNSYDIIIWSMVKF